MTECRHKVYKSKDERCAVQVSECTGYVMTFSGYLLRFATPDGGSELELAISGAIKWDGCMNIVFFPQEHRNNVAAHFCSDGLRPLVKLDALIRWAAQQEMPEHWDYEDKEQP